MNQTQPTNALHREKTSSAAAHHYNSHTMFSNSSESDQAPPLDMKEIALKFSLVLYILTVVLGIIGNSMVIFVAGLKIKTKATNVWLVNLAVADLIFCFTRIFSIAYRLQSNNWSFGSFLCKFNGFFKYANMFCSVFLLAVISVDRALCVWRPVFTKTKRTLFAARIVAVCVWILAILFSSPYFIYRHINLYKENKTKCSIDEGKGKEAKLFLYCIRFVCGFLLPFMVILVCYILAGLGLKRTNLSRKSRSLRILVMLVIAFFLCWAPYHCLQLVKMVDNYAELKPWQRITSSIAYFNSCVNPILYYCMGANVGGRFKHRLPRAYNRALADVMQEQTFQGEDNSVRSNVVSQV